MGGFFVISESIYAKLSLNTTYAIAGKILPSLFQIQNIPDLVGFYHFLGKPLIILRCDLISKLLHVDDEGIHGFKQVLPVFDKNRSPHGR